MQKISLYTILLLLSMSCSLELPENTKSLKTCIKATGITATAQSTTTPTPTLNLSINGTTSDIAKVVWIVSQNSTEYYRSGTITSSPFSLTTPTLTANGTLTITAQIIDKCGMSYNLTSSYVNKTCINATGITASSQSITPLNVNLSLTGTTSDIANVDWILRKNGLEFIRDYALTAPFSFTTSTLPTNGAITITAQIVDKCGMSYNLTSNIGISNGAILMLLPVEGGAFQMGNSTTGRPEAVPVHLVTLSSFNISKYEITQAQWKAVMGANLDGNISNCDNCPVVSVSWEDVQLFLTKLNALTGNKYRLPTEAEWEYAASGGKLSKGYLYSGSNTVGDVAWYDANSGFKTQPIGQKTANELGVYDMSGNVWEWCQDWYGAYSENTQTNPTGPITGTTRVLRGGSYYLPYWASQVAVRGTAASNQRYSELGFRVVLSQ